MKQKKMWFAGMVLFASLLCLVGCKDKGAAFIGHWIEITKNEHPMDIKITYDDGVFHVDQNKYYALGLSAYKLNKLEAKAESDNVLSLINGFGETMRLDNGVMSFANTQFKKVNTSE